MATSVVPEFNVTGQDYNDRVHFTYTGPIIDIHSHVMITRPGDPQNGPPLGTGPGASIEQARTLLKIARQFGIVRTYTMCLPDDIPPLREVFGDQLGFNGPIGKKTLESPDEEAYRTLDRFLELGVEMIKFWAAPRGRDRGLVVDAPWRLEAARRARQAGVKIIMVHVGDPDRWFQTVYADAGKFGTKPDQYRGLVHLLEGFPDMTIIAAHMGGDVEHPDHLAELLGRYPHLHLDTSATKWQVREVTPRRQAVRDLIEAFPDRILFGSDLVTRHLLEPDHYVSRYWCQRTLWESTWEGASPIADPDYISQNGEPTPPLHGVGLTGEVLEKVYYRNAARLLHLDDLTGTQ